MPSSGVYYAEDGVKSFVALENNPEVFTSLVHSLGVSPSLAFYDVYSLDEPSLLSHIPRPVLALIVIIPVAAYKNVRNAEKTGLAWEGPLTYDKSGDDEPVIWIRQTIRNACGLYALIHATANSSREYITPGSLLDTLVKQAIPLKPDQRSQILYDSKELEDLHMAAAVTGDSLAPPAEQHAAHHFAAFSKGKDGHLWELEGITDGPLDRGVLQEDQDMLSKEALEQGIKRFLKLADGHNEFSIIALAKKSE